MSPRFEGDLTNVSASQVVYPKGDYEFIVGQAKAFGGMTKEGKNAGKENYGVRYPLKIAGGEFDGKGYLKNNYMHSPEAQPMAKQFLMAALGFNPRSKEEEERFNKEHAGADWSFDPETGAVGDIWAKASGQRVIGTLDVDKNANGDETQKEKGWRPIGK